MKFFFIIFFLLITSGLAAENNNPDDALLKAAERCDYYGIMAALSKGAYINARDAAGKTPLILASGNYSSDISYNRKYNIINLLLSKGADINAKDNAGNTAVVYYSSDPSAGTRTRISDLLEYYPGSSKSRKLIAKNMDSSYVGFFPLYIDDRKISSTEFVELEMNLPLNLFGTNPSENFNYFMNFSGKLNYRILREMSAPLRTPGFMPGGNLYFWWNRLNRNLSKHVDFMYFSFMFRHHSNGQNGNIYTPDGRINTESGNFSTNFAEFSISTIVPENLWINMAYQRHVTFAGREYELTGQY